MSNRFVDNVTQLNATTLNKLEDDLKDYADNKASSTATQYTAGVIKIWASGNTLYIKTN